MFLIEFANGCFIDGRRINYIGFEGGEVKFTLNGESDGVYVVESGREGVFLNHAQALNSNITNISARYEHETNPDTKY